MKPPIERIKLSETAKNQLTGLKRKLKIQNWNTLTRWALMYSLQEPNSVSPVPIPADSNVEMSWQVFAGRWSDVLILAFRQRCLEEGISLDDDVVAHFFRLHLHRGIAYMSSNLSHNAKERGNDRIPYLIETAIKGFPRHREPDLDLAEDAIAIL